MPGAVYEVRSGRNAHTVDGKDDYAGISARRFGFGCACRSAGPGTGCTAAHSPGPVARRGDPLGLPPRSHRRSRGGALFRACRDRCRAPRAQPLRLSPWPQSGDACAYRHRRRQGLSGRLAPGRSHRRGAGDFRRAPAGGPGDLRLRLRRRLPGRPRGPVPRQGRGCLVRLVAVRIDRRPRRLSRLRPAGLQTALHRDPAHPARADRRVQCARNRG